MYARIVATVSTAALVPTSYMVFQSEKALGYANKMILSEQAVNTELRRQIDWQTQDLLLIREELKAAHKTIEEDRSGAAFAAAVTTIGVAGLAALATLR